MIAEIKIPSPGESITEVEIATWFISDGDIVQKDQELGEVESEKATLPLIADISGEVKLLAKEGETVPVGKIVCTIDSSKAEEAPKTKKTDTPPAKAPAEDSTPAPIVKPEPSAPSDEFVTDSAKKDTGKLKPTPLAKSIIQKEGYKTEDIIKGLQKLGSKDLDHAINAISSVIPEDTAISREVKREKMSNLRAKLSQRLVAVKNETAMLTTFNEADMSNIIYLRKKYQPEFVEKFGIKLGFMSFFTKAVTIALQQFPQVNSHIEDNEIVSPRYCDIGIAVQTNKGLMVPVVRNTETLSLAETEKQIMELAVRARKNRISIEEMSGGTFTITNGGIFGSMMSTPILNPPQAAILGMHAIIERPVAIEGKVEIRPMMYLALSYDHRIIDGRDSVSFLVKVKELVEKPELMLHQGRNPEKQLLGL